MKNLIQLFALAPGACARTTQHNTTQHNTTQHNPVAQGSAYLESNLK